MDPSTSQDILEKLSKASRRVQTVVAGNPNASFKVLINLAVIFPRIVENNMGLWLSEVDQIQTKDADIIQAYLAMAKFGTNRRRLEFLAGHPDRAVRVEVARNILTPARCLEDLAEDPDYEVRVACASNQSTPPEILAAMEEPSHLPSSSRILNALVENVSTPEPRIYAICEDQVRFDLDLWVDFTVHNPSVSPRCLAILASSKREGILMAVASHPETPMEKIFELAKNTSSYVAINAIQNIGVTAERMLEHLRSTGALNDIAQSAMAYRDDLDASMMSTIVEAGFEKACVNLASNPTTPVAILQMLAWKNFLAVDMKLSSNKNTPTDVLDVIAKRTDSDIGKSIAIHPNCSADTLTYLSKRSSATRLLENVAGNKRTPTKVLRKLSRHPNHLVVCQVARNESTTVDVLDQLAASKLEDVRKSLARNPCVPLAILEALAKDKNFMVRYCVATHPRLPLLSMKSLAQDDDPDVRAQITKNSCAPREILESLAQDTSFKVVLAVAESDFAPPELVQQAKARLPPMEDV